MREEIFPKKCTPGIKGIAILLMVSLHLLQINWMPDSSMIVDFRLHGIPVSSIIAYAGDICIGMFAFLSGYGWAHTFDKKTKVKRIADLYQTYWLVLLFWGLPIRLIISFCTSNEVTISAKDIILSVLGIRSSSIMFGWYVFFYGCAVLTFGPIWNIVKNKHTLITVVLLIGFSIVPRFFLSLVYHYISISPIIRDEVSHYINWMPVVLLGALTKDRSIFEYIDSRLNSLMKSTIKWWLCLVAFISFIIAKALFQFFTSITTNVDAIIIIPFMYCSLVVIKQIYDGKVERVLRLLGGISLYIWLTHRVLLYEPLRQLTLNIRIPGLIVIVAVVALVPFCYMLQLLDKKVSNISVVKGK